MTLLRCDSGGMQRRSIHGGAASCNGCGRPECQCNMYITLQGFMDAVGTCFPNYDIGENLKISSGALNGTIKLKCITGSSVDPPTDSSLFFGWRGDFPDPLTFDIYANGSGTCTGTSHMTVAITSIEVTYTFEGGPPGVVQVEYTHVAGDPLPVPFWGSDPDPFLGELDDIDCNADSTIICANSSFETSFPFYGGCYCLHKSPTPPTFDCSMCASKVCWYKWTKHWECNQGNVWTNVSNPTDNPDTNITCEATSEHSDGIHNTVDNGDGTATDTIYVMGESCTADDGCTSIPDDPGGPGDDVTDTLFAGCDDSGCCPSGNKHLTPIAFIDATGIRYPTHYDVGALGTYVVCYMYGGVLCPDGWSLGGIVFGTPVNIDIGNFDNSYAVPSPSGTPFPDLSSLQEAMHTSTICQCLAILTDGQNTDINASFDVGSGPGCDYSLPVVFQIFRCDPTDSVKKPLKGVVSTRVQDSRSFGMPPDPILLASRLAICTPCQHNKSLFDKTVNDHRVVAVKCDACTTCTGGRSLSSANQACPIGKW